MVGRGFAAAVGAMDVALLMIPAGVMFGLGVLAGWWLL